jgi:thiamine biosynthesis lipoprotein
MNTLSRRRFLKISAACAALAPFLPAGAAVRPDTDVPLRRWHGTSLGAEAQILLYHSDASEADRLIQLALQEVARLEQVFSLYRPDSSLSVLNREGQLRDPPFELVQLLAQSRRFSELTGGAFDVTVQPLWDLYSAHFRAPDADPAGPPAAAIAAARQRVGFRRIGLDLDHVRLDRGMAVTLNGIAQGYITDRVAELLRSNGLEYVLVDLDEYRAVGPQADGAPWSIGIEDPRQPGQVIKRVLIADRAMGTSGGYGTQFDAAGRFNHIFDPGTGHCADRYLSVSVVADRGATADALSTAFCVMPEEGIRQVTARLGTASAIIVAKDGSIAVHGRASTTGGSTKDSPITAV